MSKARILFIAGVFIAVLPYLGFPVSWKNIMFSLMGLGLAFFAYILHRDKVRRNKKENAFENFRENSDFTERPHEEVQA